MRRKRFNVEWELNGQWQVAYRDALTPGHADGQMAHLAKHHPETKFRVVESEAFVPHRANYR